LTIAAPAGDTVTVRVANHSDAYGTSDYTADGMEGTDAGAITFLKSWMAEQCERNEQTRESVNAFLDAAANVKALQSKVRTLAKKFQVTRGEYLLTETGEQWYPVRYCFDKAKDTNVHCLQNEIARLNAQMEIA
jgi:hypothetical protein